MLKRTCSSCKKEFEFDVDEFLKSGKNQVVCGECREGILLTKSQAYDIVYGGYSFADIDDDDPYVPWEFPWDF